MISNKFIPNITTNEFGREHSRSPDSEKTVADHRCEEAGDVVAWMTETTQLYVRNMCTGKTTAPREDRSALVTDVYVRENNPNARKKLSRKRERCGQNEKRCSEAKDWRRCSCMQPIAIRIDRLGELARNHTQAGRTYRKVDVHKDGF